MCTFSFTCLGFMSPHVIAHLMYIKIFGLLLINILVPVLSMYVIVHVRGGWVLFGKSLF